ncbi:aldose epimerase family protein [Ancylobacter sp. VNQ12]|uniref:aldose epimerase family protein n=1 Tax=Ancylobacter sp. VNQ12 TaxID=3400920 RepID=UPI003C106DA6
MSRIERVGEADGSPIHEITLTGPDGSSARVLSWGATLRDLLVPGPDGAPVRVVLGYDNFEPYLTNPSYLGATCGRVANRIRAGRFRLDGRDYDVGRNEDGITHLHGGARGFSHRPWDIVAADATAVTLTRQSPDGEEGYPGTLDVRCTYRLSAPATITVEMTATTDAPTAVNLAHHSYFTLDPEGSVRDLEVEIAAHRYTPVGGELVPTGQVSPVAGTPFDFVRPRRLADQATLYDVNFVLDGTPHAPPRIAARARSPRTGMSLTVFTTEPGLQLYDGQYLQPTEHGLGGQRHGPHAGICFEAQNFPDAVNHTAFPSPWLRPGRTYRQVTRYHFATGETPSE